MKQRTLGASGLSVAPIMLGGNVFGWTADEKTSFAVLDAFAAGGGNFIDTADVYSAWIPGNSGGESETLIGKWLRGRGRRDKMVIATKVGMLEGEGGKGLKASRIAAACEASLKRLQTDVIDVYFAHRDDPETPLDETLDAFDALVKAGKVRAIGASNYSAERLAEARAISDRNGWARFTVLQPQYNLLKRGDYEGPLQRLAIDEMIGVVPYYGLASGYLSGKYRTPADLSGARAAAVKKWMDGQGASVLAALDSVSAETGASLAAIALAWVKEQPGITAPIASASKPEQVADLITAATLTLTPDQLSRLTAAGHQ
ncbi:aldo/keto reductase [Sphingosinicella microcystinivorans]|uniref:Aryl-alcohol dehydrogenase-like predicted oxidoreductase n=1 Tax=Sphingosinicella microcystinivorans TaxID=335406 RepID=A0AAD1D9J5_SPHMI|nr:aldo/keto reductase [Sphingosinicella microcystinivorans]RKS87943.1 aryl-alcohol dehydrogenase-like predicted oxidoreductase [Sphingosinicella microcystinivorans]BBE35754.1 NADP-dependent aryl-alcohol dehydrogenase [Sphingosinicella microcystinivorans]